MKLSCLMLAAVLPALITSAMAADPIGGMRLLPGYRHEPLQGIDSIVGKVLKKDGLEIMYEIGGVVPPGAPRFGGSFTDRPKLTPKDQVRWYREQVVRGQPVHLAYRKDNVLMVSYPKQGMNLSVTVGNADEMAEALLMILTYPDPLEEEKESKKK